MLFCCCFSSNYSLFLCIIVLFIFFFSILHAYSDLFVDFTVLCCPSCMPAVFEVSPGVTHFKNLKKVCSLGDGGQWCVWQHLSWRVLKVVVIPSVSSSIIRCGANFPPIVAQKDLQMLVSINYSKLNLNMMFFGLIIFFSLTWKFIIMSSWSLPTSAPENVIVFALLMPDWKWFWTNM